ncbi:hypothetical protein VLK81_04810 [Citroniella saccharovorans]|uniref:Uncharacterized protein n=1 Tax=Citroniella saccharovorans TaxID=2053367 RepID=A0AAW9MT38_9FIRM|nr:hypothetical protein [Citroniella saccharovorans]MEB3429341.1 hypothetical protein [Citroniella saccharovorans]
MKRKNLVILAGIIWIFAGLKVSAIGIDDFFNLENKVLLFIPISAIIYFLFFLKIFSPMVDKNIQRIESLSKDNIKLWKFLDKKSYIIMILMMSFGIILRKFTHLPLTFFFVFYSGLGLALFSAGIKYFFKLIRGELLDA